MTDDDTTEIVEVTPVVGDPAKLVALLRDYAAAEQAKTEED